MISTPSRAVTLPKETYEEILRVLRATAALPDRWLEPCPFSLTGDCESHGSPQCPTQRALALLETLFRLESAAERSAR
jgi:hypothetical protein